MRVLRVLCLRANRLKKLARINVANLVDYAVKYLHMDDADVIYATNTLLDMMGLTEPVEEPAAKYDFYETLSALSAYAVRRGICREEDRLLFETRIMGALTPPAFQGHRDLRQHRGAERQHESRRVAWRPLGKIGVHPPSRHRPQCAVGIRQPPRQDSHHHQPRQAREDPRRGQTRQRGKDGAIPKCMLCAENVGLRRQRRASRPSDPAHHPLRAGRRGMVPAILPLRLLRAARHRDLPRASVR